MRTNCRTNAAAVQRTPRTTIDAITSPLSAPSPPPGQAAAANGATRTVLITSETADRAARVEGAEVPLDDERTDRVAEHRDEQARGTEQLVRLARDIDPEQRDDAAEADEQARPGATRSPARTRRSAIASTAIVSGTAATRIAARPEEMYCSPSATIGSGIDVSNDGEREDRPPVAPMPSSAPAGVGQWQHHRRGERDPRERQERRRHLVHGDLDEEVRDAPEDRDGGERRPAARSHAGECGVARYRPVRVGDRAHHASREETEITRPAAPPARRGGVGMAVVRSMRPKQWVKNVLVFAAPGGRRRPARRAPRCATRVVAFVAFCLVASGTYLLNDALDVEADRQHPTKRHRPIAAGRSSRAWAWPRSRRGAARRRRRSSRLRRATGGSSLVLAVYVVAHAAPTARGSSTSRSSTLVDRRRPASCCAPIAGGVGDRRRAVGLVPHRRRRSARCSSSPASATPSSSTLGDARGEHRAGARRVLAELPRPVRRRGQRRGGDHRLLPVGAERRRRRHAIRGSSCRSCRSCSAILRYALLAERGRGAARPRSAARRPHAAGPRPACGCAASGGAASMPRLSRRGCSPAGAAPPPTRSRRRCTRTRSPRRARRCKTAGRARRRRARARAQPTATPRRTRGGTVLDVTALAGVRAFDAATGAVTVDGGHQPRRAAARARAARAGSCRSRRARAS